MSAEGISIEKRHRSQVLYILYGIALAMGIAAILLPIIQPGTDVVLFLGIGLFALALAGLISIGD